ncbi:MAG TPA: alcohol dehydrogenase catalytic domain-containing protein [bacterium]|nr:alcohol dehydrogenase catalytic domain-containing protein [bacterium]
MRALVWHGPRAMALEQVGEPKPGPGDTVIRVEAVGICGSELSGYLGESSIRKPPLIMGHEFCGRVEEIPPGSCLVRGQRVTVNPLISCGECRACRTGAQNLCARREIIGAHRSGAFADLVAVPARNCYPVFAEMAPATAAMAEPLACAVRAVELAQIVPGDSVLVLGSGTIGLCVLAVARRAGAGVLAVTDTNPARLRTARAWGATHVFDGTDDAAIRALTEGAGVDVAVDAVGRAVTRRAAVRLVRRGGRVVLVGLHEAETVFPVNDMVRNETLMTGSFAYRVDTFERALSLLGAGILEAGPWLEERPLESGPGAFEQLLRGDASAAKIVLTP